MNLDTSITNPSEARAALSREVLALGPGGQGMFAQLMSVTTTTVGYWLKGKRCPGPLHRAQIEIRCGIPQRAWWPRKNREAVKSKAA
jgi:hypothetical protein